MLIHPHGPQIVALLDRELSSIGNPVADFAYHLMSSRFAPVLFRGLAGTGFAAAGIPDEAADARARDAGAKARPISDLAGTLARTLRFAPKVHNPPVQPSRRETG